ncbi:hypothetical protein STEG23_010570 [Scotinomys teguina]
MEPWKQCAQWLIHCKVLPANHRVTWDSAQVFDLAQTLRDGVLLCQLLNNLRAHSINLKEINLRPQMSQAVPKKNTDCKWVTQTAALQGWKHWAGAAIQSKGLAAMTRTEAADGEMIEFGMHFEGRDQLATLVYLTERV